MWAPPGSSPGKVEGRGKGQGRVPEVPREASDGGWRSAPKLPRGNSGSTGRGHRSRRATRRRARPPDESTGGPGLVGRAPVHGARGDGQARSRKSSVTRLCNTNHQEENNSYFQFGAHDARRRGRHRGGETLRVCAGREPSSGTVPERGDSAPGLCPRSADKPVQRQALLCHTLNQLGWSWLPWVLSNELPEETHPPVQRCQRGKARPWG